MSLIGETADLTYHAGCLDSVLINPETLP